MVEIIQQKPAFELSAHDYNGEGEEILISWQDLIEAKPGDEWCARSGNTLRECTTYDLLKILFKTENYIVAVNEWETVGTYPNYEVTQKARLIIFCLNPEVELQEEIKRVIKE